MFSDSEIALQITGFGQFKGNPFPYFNLQFRKDEPIVFGPEEKQPTSDCNTTPLELRKLYKDILSLTGLPEGTILTIVSKYYIEKFKKDYLVLVESGGKHFFAGPEAYEPNILGGTRIRLGKTKCSTNSSKTRYRTFVTIQKGEWWKLVDKKDVGRKVQVDPKEVVDVMQMAINTVFALLTNGNIVSVRKGEVFNIATKDKCTTFREKIEQEELERADRKFWKEASDKAWMQTFMAEGRKKRLITKQDVDSLRVPIALVKSCYEELKKANDDKTTKATNDKTTEVDKATKVDVESKTTKVESRATKIYKTIGVEVLSCSSAWRFSKY